MLLKCADIGHLAAPPASHKRWALQLEEEFFQQVLPFNAPLSQLYNLCILKLAQQCDCDIQHLSLLSATSMSLLQLPGTHLKAAVEQQPL